MTVPLENKNVLVIGLGASGLAAGALLRSRGANVFGVDNADTEALRRETASLRSQGAQVHLGATSAPAGHFDLVVVSPGVPSTHPILKAMHERGAPIIRELEL